MKKSVGQALVEFAFILPLLLLLITLILDLGRVVFYYSVISNAAKEGARYGAVNKSWTDIYNYTIGYTQVLDQTQIEVLPAINLVDEDNRHVKIDITYTFHPVTPFAPLFIGKDGLEMHASSIMRVEY